MTNRKKLIGAAAFTVALAGGGVAGAVLGVPGVSGAQEPTITVADGPHGGDVGFAISAGGPGFGFRHEARMAGLDAAADAIGITVDELRDALQDGKTIAEVAGEHDVDVQTVVDAMVAEATAELTEHITDLVNNGFPDRPERGVKLDAVADALGLTDEELRAALQDGQSLADIAEAHGVDVQDVIDALVEAGVPADRAEALVEHAGPFFRGGHRHP